MTPSVMPTAVLALIAFVLAGALADSGSLTVESDVRAFARAARFPGAPGNDRPAPSAPEAGRIRARILEWKGAEERVLAKISATDALARAEGYLDRILLPYTMGLVAMGLPHGPTELDGLGLRVPLEVARELDPGKAGVEPVGGQARVGLPGLTIQAIELAHLSAAGGADSAFELARSLVLEQLARSLADLEELRAVPRAGVEFPAALIPWVEEERGTLAKERRARQALIREAPLDRIERFDPNAPNAWAAPWLEQEILGARTRVADEERPAHGRLPRESIDSEALAGELAERLANALAAAELERAMDAIRAGAIELDEGELLGFLSSVEARRVDFAARLPRATLADWARAARESARTGGDARAEWIARLVARARESAARNAIERAGLRVMPSALRRALAGRIARIEPSGEVLDAVAEIARATGYLAARETWIARMDALREPALAVEPVSRAGKAALGAARLAREEDLRDLGEVGVFFGFESWRGRGEPRLWQILGAADRKRYARALADETVEREPILSQPIEWAGNTQALREVLVALPTEGPFDLPVERAIDGRQAAIREATDAVARAREPEDLKPVILSSILLQRALLGAPELAGGFEELAESLANPTLADRVAHEYLGPFIAVGFGAYLMVKLAGVGSRRLAPGVFPFIDAITSPASPMAPVLRSWLWSAGLLMVPDAAYQALELSELKRDREVARFLAAAGTPWIGESEAGRLSGAYTRARWALAATCVFGAAGIRGLR